jgi:hypothetical protein
MEISEQEFLANDLWSEKISIVAKATFADGSISELPFTIDLTSMGLFSYQPSKMESAKNQEEFVKRQEFYDSLTLADCELVPDSVSKLTALFKEQYGSDALYYEYDVNNGSPSAMQIYQDLLDFDEDGLSRTGSIVGGIDGNTYFVVVTRDADGELIGMLYKMPPMLP